jgi:gamma-glutamyltranspeptidase/glutathione hydrolase
MSGGMFNPKSKSENPKCARGWRRFAACAVMAGVAIIGPSFAAEPEYVARGAHGMVASDSPYASQIGCDVLKAGGNAIDAAVATSLALAVSRPFSTGLGGGQFMMVRMANGEVYVLDSRECAPAAATADMFVKARAASPDGPRPSEYGGMAAGVPGLLAGHQAVLDRLGTRKLRELIAPARKLAMEGFAIDASYVDAAGAVRKDLAQFPSLRASTEGLQREFLLDQADLAVGTVLRRPALAAAMELIGTEGVDAFYRGKIAESIVQAVKATGGVMTAADLASYQPKWRTPLRIRYRDRYEFLLMPPASSGGIAIAEMLNILEHWDLASIHAKDPALAAHLTVEAMKHAFADRARYLGDTDFVPVPVDKLAGKAYAAELAKRIREDGVTEPDAYGTIPPNDAGTSHYCVADRWGNVVSATETINTSWGSLVLVEPWGIVLNNEMDDFTAEPDRSNAYGLRQSAANAVAAGKRPLSCMSPTIVLENGKPLLAVGASGGPRIITGTLQVILNVVDYRLGLAEAVGRPRFHHQWQPNEVSRNEFAADDPVIQGLKQRGHAIGEKKRGAIVQALLIGADGFEGASDPRKGGKPAGY